MPQIDLPKTIAQTPVTSVNLMNPYKAPSTQPFDGRQDSRSRSIGPLFIAILLVVAVMMGFISPFIPSVRAVMMPRFGWVGLIFCLNPLIFLLQWFWRPNRKALMGAAFMAFSIGVINAVQLSSQTTVSIVVNEFHDRLHSSWLWSVLSFFVIGVYLSWLSVSMSVNSNSRVN
jgi:hypothetical protein